MNGQSMDIGIDLGTTFSVIGVEGQVKLVDGYPQPIYLSECNVTIISTPDGDATFPSVFWVDPQDSSRIVIGMEARQKAQSGDAPIMFSKRSIGTNEAMKIHDRTFTAKEVATHILRYLKDCAERALGQPVRRAVVTHPAYFDPNQRQETCEAAIAAGFDMSLPDEQMLMEPVAAALAYLRGVDKDPLKVMTYDLGGGTFDVTVLERNRGIITMKAFDGNPLLGGYNFDRMLVQWILDKLKAAGRVIPYDDSNTEDRGRRGRLLQIAETVKINLTEQRTAKAPVDVRVQNILVDADGKVVQFLEKITREQYAALIKDYLEETIQRSKSALAKANVGVEELDAILLVGGSTYGQWVIEAVKKAFGEDVQLFNPDLCVAAGAGIRAGELPPVAAGEGMELVLDVASVCALPTINVAGTLRLVSGSDLTERDRADLRVLLTIPSGSVLGPCPLGPHGEILFKDVALEEEGPSEFTLQISDNKGLQRLSKTFTVEYRLEGGDATEIYTVLPKPIYLKAKGGMKLVAEEGVPLPAKCEIRGKRLQDDDSLDIDVYQGNEKISTIEVGDIPADAGRGSPVVVTVEITQKNEMKGTVTILSRADSVVAQRPVRIKFPPLLLPPLPELRVRYDELEAKRQELEALSNDPKQRVLLGGKGKKISDKLARLFAEQAPDRQEIHVMLKELDQLVNPPPEDMDPPLMQFRQTVEACQEMLNTLGSDPQVPPLEKLLKRLENDGNDAHTTKNHKKWSATNESLIKLYIRIQKIIGGGNGGDDEPDPTWMQKDRAIQEMDSLQGQLQSKRQQYETHPRYATHIRKRLDDIEKRIELVASAIAKVDDNLDPKQGHAQIELAKRPKMSIVKDLEDVGEGWETVR